jgi:hypothetical protein
MNNLSVVLPKLFSELLINLSAGFLGAAIIVPIQTPKVGNVRITILLMNIIISCFLFASAVILNT